MNTSNPEFITADRVHRCAINVPMDGNQPKPIPDDHPAIKRALLALEAKRRAGEFQGPISCNMVALAFNAVLAELLR